MILKMTPGIEPGPPAWEVSAHIINQLLSEVLWLQNGTHDRFDKGSRSIKVVK